MRHLLLCCFILGLEVQLFAQETVFPIGKEVVGRKLYLATDSDSMQAFVLVGLESLQFWIKKNGTYVNAGDQKQFGVKEYIGSFCSADKVSFFFEVGSEKKVMRYDIDVQGKDGGVAATPLTGPEGKPVNNFVHKNTLNHLVFNKGSNSLRLRQYGADGKAVDLEYILPQIKALAYANTTYSDIKNLNYRSSFLVDPTILCNRQHIYMEDDAMYLVYPKFTGSSEVFIIVKLGLKDGKLSKNIVYHSNATNSINANLYFTNNSFLHYTSSLSQITLTSINPVNWEKKDLYTLSENDEKLNNIPLRQEDTTVSNIYPSGFWHLSGDKDKKVTQKKLLRKLYNGGESYVYVHPTKDSTNVQEIVLGRYGVYQNTIMGSSLTNITGAPQKLIGIETSTYHRYVVLEHDKRTGTIQPTQAAIKSLADLAKDTTDNESWITLLFPGLDKKITPTIHHVGDRALIAYIDKKREAVIVRYEPLK